ncbi:hypothetical protein NW762_003573 [Fusarium torreyae]|uniref:Uncharacterized protein n=1 Tax=Fusarium torreyae TaxID=1237075 RepID=A0A9W8SAA9_9HYPO|nr:hypothetical protein NW762_003573 [Fusarium torreyae]
MITDDQNTEHGSTPQEIEQPVPGPEDSHEGSQASTEYESTPTSEKNVMSEEHEPLLQPSEASIVNDEDQDAPDAEDGSRTQAESSQSIAPDTQSSQSVRDGTANPYLDNREARREHDKKWWGDRHNPPPLGDANRQHLFSWNPPISGEEVQRTLAAFHDRIRDPDTGELNPLGAHLRPSTPPLERAKKQVQSLKDNGVNVTLDLVKEMYDHHTKNNGLQPALQEWCQGKDAVPVEHVNELLKMLDRLKLEMAKQQRDTNDKLSQVTKNYDENKGALEKSEQELNELTKLYEQLEKEKEETEKKLENKQKDIDHFEKTRASHHARRHSDAGSSKPSEPLNPRRAGIQLQKEYIKKELQQMKAIHNLEEKVAHLEEENESLKANGTPAPASLESEQQLSLNLQDIQKKYELAMSLLEEAENDRKGAEEARKDAEEEVAKYRGFHNNFYSQLRESAGTWTTAASFIRNLQEEATDKFSEESRQIIIEAAKEWETLETNYEKDWPPNKEAFEKGKLGQNLVTLEKLERSERKLQETFDLNKRLIGGIQLQLEDREVKANKLVKLARDMRTLQDETLTQGRVEEIPDVKPSFEIPRTPLWPSGTSAKTSGSGSGDASSSSQTNEQMEAEIRSLKGECANLDNKILVAEKEVKQLKQTNKALRDIGVTNEKLEAFLQEKEKSISTLLEEVEGLRKEIRTLRDESKELKASRAREMGTAQELSKYKTTMQQQGVEIKNLRAQIDRTQNRNQSLQDVNFNTADSLISAIRKQAKAPKAADGKTPKEYGSESDELGLMDRINYLNMACFFRTRNYIQLALREGANRLANVLITDAEKWAKFCHDDLAKMHPSVNDNIAASMRILNGVRRIMTAEKEQGVTKGIKSVQAGRNKLAKTHDQLAFGQLVQLADTILDWTQGMRTGEVQEGCKKLFKKSRKFKRGGGLSSEQRIRVGELQEEIKKNPGMKADALRRSGFHSPLSPEKWAKNLDEGFDSEVVEE